MKKGFLAAHARHDPGTSTAAAAANGQARDLLDDTPQQHPAKPHEPTGAEAKAAAEDVRQSANWQQCLELLRSDVDEKKFVGLLLVTKLLPQGDDAAVQAVLDAVGFAFLQRLLLPLQQQQQQQQQQQLVGLLEQLADIHAPERQHHASSSSELQPQLAAAGGSSVRAVQLCEVLPVLGQRQVEQLMARLLQVTEVICEFLEHAAPAAISSGSSSAAIDPLLAVGAVRVLGRFLADVPDAHQESLQKLLPQLLVLTIPGQDQGLSGSSAVCFLLPALLCWTAPSNDSQQQWAAVLLDPGNGCLLQLAGFAELLVEGRSGSLLQMLEGAAWMKAAALALAAVDAIASGRHRQVAEDDAAAQVVVEDNMAVQLLARAVSRV
ncbi:hypothetical protein OEZ86_002902 [Tetradesmus obliquus]|nr:hypothetical protein OEZ86_002902 [Tetradesmus obliquus]